MDNYILPLEWDETKQRSYRPYKTLKDAPNFKSMHFGQRKLLLSEIMFLTLHGVENDVVIYAGAAPSDHLIFLSSLFPSFTFILVDPEKWNSKFISLHPDLGQTNFSEEVKHYKITDKIQVVHGFFSNSLAHSLGQKYNDRSVLFISDIRPTNIDESSKDIEARNAIVNENMRMQRAWFGILNLSREAKKKVWAMFKFKADFEHPTTEYLSGDLYYQPWAPLRSPELRLITNQDSTCVYDNKWLEQHMIWYNEVKRNTKEGEVYSDAKFEHTICSLYLSKFPSSHKGKHSLMVAISLALNQKDFNNNLYCFQPGYVPNKHSQQRLINSIIAKDTKYS
jgi:Poly A polymerase regulatory subunit